ncbi:MAG: hypothetical protein AAGN66_12130 [Acidobacteriota bacterium]
MVAVHESYVTNAEGERTAVIVPLEEWRSILEALEELADIRAYDEAKSQHSEVLPFEQALSEIEEGRRIYR